jgi:hypothetical protein
MKLHTKSLSVERHVFLEREREEKRAVRFIVNNCVCVLFTL